MDLSIVLIIVAIAFGLVGVGLWPFIGFLKKRAVLDIPNDRSSHTIPTPKGAGLVLVSACLLIWIVSSPSPAVFALCGSAIVLLVVSWVDDTRTLSPIYRLGFHVAAVTFGLFAIPQTALIFQGLLPLPLDRALALLLWVWFINLFNFMDGIDGISAIETLVIAAGLIIAANLAPSDSVLAAALIGAAAGFLPWNWSPARIFLGDAGSAPIGFLLGWLLISAAANGDWAVAMILPGYYLADSGLTLLKRLARRERVWEAHREHAYQKAAAQIGHARTSVFVAVGGAGAIFIATVGAQISQLMAVMIAVGLSVSMYVVLHGLGR